MNLQNGLPQSGASPQNDCTFNFSMPSVAGPSLCSKIDCYNSAKPMSLALASEIALLFVEVYGENYPDYIITEPEKFVEEVNSDQLTVFVARSSSGELLGHAALVNYAPKLIEFGRDVVAKNAQGMGISKILMQERLNYLSTNLKDVDCCITETVTGHARSQTTYLKNGFSPAGLFAGIYTDFFELGARESTVLMAKIVNPVVCEPRDIYLPQSYAKIAANLYSDLGCDRNIITTSSVSESQHSSFEVSLNDLSGFGIAKFTLNSGNDLQAMLQLMDCLSKNYEADYFSIALDCSNPALLLCIEELQKCGFCFAGILPLEDGDKLYLQSIGIEPKQLSNLTLVADRSKEIRELIVCEGE